MAAMRVWLRVLAFYETHPRRAVALIALLAVAGWVTFLLVSQDAGLGIAVLAGAAMLPFVFLTDGASGGTMSDGSRPYDVDASDGPAIGGDGGS